MSATVYTAAEVDAAIAAAIKALPAPVIPPSVIVSPTAPTGAPDGTVWVQL